MIKDTYYDGTKHLSPKLKDFLDIDWGEVGGRRCDILKTDAPTDTNIAGAIDFVTQPPFLIIMSEDSPGIWLYTAANFITRVWYTDGWYINEWRPVNRNYLWINEIAAAQFVGTYVGSFTNIAYDLDIDNVDPVSISDKYMLGVDLGAATGVLKVYDGAAYQERYAKVYDGTKWAYTTRRYATGSSVGVAVASTLGWEAKYILVTSAVAGVWLFIKEGFNYYPDLVYQLLYVGSSTHVVYVAEFITGTWDETSFNLTLPLAISTTNTWYAWE